eukprot:TRINITY_DN10102_c0_g1_i7.p1 TRINITY_DN10102_c0_g1~~TRINITY_DN10102_c0_g1_i7.p1  ORF type:complete len:375 (-),score=74.03 TRINITY_DN10102_c0_g1_i7:197-1321(-)
MISKHGGIFKAPKNREGEIAQGFYPSTASWIQLRNSEIVDRQDYSNGSNEWEGQGNIDRDYHVPPRSRRYRNGHTSVANPRGFHNKPRIHKHKERLNSFSGESGSDSKDSGVVTRSRARRSRGCSNFVEHGRIARSSLARGSRGRRRGRFREPARDRGDHWANVVEVHPIVQSEIEYDAWELPAREAVKSEYDKEWDEVVVEELAEDKKFVLPEKYNIKKLEEDDWDSVAQEENKSIAKSQKAQLSHKEISEHELLLQNLSKPNEESTEESEWDLALKEELPAEDRHSVEQENKEEQRRINGMMDELREQMARLMETEKLKMEKEMLQEQLARTDELLSNYVCPISVEIINDPVIAEDGQTYEKNCNRKVVEVK